MNDQIKCEKCGSPWLKLEEEYDGYYSHCTSCGKLTLIQSKLIELDDIDLELEEPPVIYSTQNHNKCFQYFILAIVKELGICSSGQVRDRAEEIGHERLVDEKTNNKVTTSLCMSFNRGFLDRLVESRGQAGGSTWQINKCGLGYLNAQPRAKSTRPNHAQRTRYEYYNYTPVSSPERLAYIRRRKALLTEVLGERYSTKYSGQVLERVYRNIIEQQQAKEQAPVVMPHLPMKSWIESTLR